MVAALLAEAKRRVLQHQPPRNLLLSLPYSPIYEKSQCGPQLHSSAHYTDCFKHLVLTSGALEWPQSVISFKVLLPDM